jgi:hypothetical protein
MNVNNFLARLSESDPAPFEEKEKKCREVYDYWFNLTEKGGKKD